MADHGAEVIRIESRHEGAPDRDLREAYDDPQVRAREMVLVDPRGWRRIGLPLEYRNEPGGASFDSLGDDSDEIPGVLAMPSPRSPR